MTAPLTPGDCDLQDFPFMPLHVARLCDSDMANEGRPEGNWYAVLLWAKAWHQIPAASLPDNETVLAKFCGLGRDLKTFRKFRAEALRGFVLCGDGRLYHPIVAEVARDSWRRKLEQRWRTECARIKKANQRTGGNEPTPTLDEFLSGTSPACPAPVPGDSEECPSGHGVQEIGTGIGMGTEEEEAIASIVVAASPAPTPTPGLFEVEATKPEPKGRGRTYPEAFEAAWKAYPHTKGRSSKPLALSRWQKLPKAEQAIMAEAGRRFAPHVPTVCGGKGAPDMAVWIGEGKHLNWIEDEAAALPKTWPGPADLRAEIVRRTDDDFALKWLDPCDWRSGPDRLVAPNKFVATQLHNGAGTILAARSITLTIKAGEAVAA